VLVRGAAPVKGNDRTLVFEPHPYPPELRAVVRAPELVDPPRPVRDRWVEHRLGPPGTELLGAVGAEVGDRADRDHRPGLRGAPPGDAGDDGIPPRDFDQQLATALGNAGVGGLGRDWGEGPVEVEQDRRVGWVVPERRERLGAE